MSSRSSPVQIPCRSACSSGGGRAIDDPFGSSPPGSWEARLRRRLEEQLDRRSSSVALKSISSIDRDLANERILAELGSANKERKSR